MNMQIIKKVVCQEYGCTEDMIDAKDRHYFVVRSRQLCMFFAKEYELGTYAKIGKFFGCKDHATVIYSIKVIRNELDTSKQFVEIFKKIENRLSVIEATGYITLNLSKLDIIEMIHDILKEEHYPFARRYDEAFHLMMNLAEKIMSK